MTELYIDGVAAVLGKDFNIQVRRENGRWLDDPT